MPKLRKSGTKLRPCFAGCKTEHGPILVPSPQKFCSRGCFQAFLREAGSDARNIYDQLDHVRRESIDDWRDAKSRRTVESGDYKPRFQPHGEKCLCDPCDTHVKPLMPGATKVVDDADHAYQRCEWHTAYAIGKGPKERLVQVYPSGKGYLWAESWNRKLRHDSGNTKRLRELTKRDKRFTLIHDGEDGVSIEFHESHFSVLREYLSQS